MIKTTFTYAGILLQIGLIGLGLYEAWIGDWTSVFIVSQAILISFLPHALSRWCGIYTPSPLRIGIIVFMFSTLILGEVAGFYATFWWWDLILHAAASIGLTLISFITLLVFISQTELRSTPFFTSFLAVSLSLSAAVLWEIYEFIIDFFFVTDMPMQLSNTDTMTDLMISVVGALSVGVSGYRYLRWKTNDALGRIIHQGAKRNAI